MIQKIETRKGSWTSLDGTVKLTFKASANQGAECEGALLYNRLDEKIFLDCRGQNSESVFVFKTEDRNFELYLPSHKKIYKGNIFSIENSTEIESHLRPLDFYRALKPAAFSATDVLSSKDKAGGISITVKSGNGQRRKIEMTNAGDISREAYEGADGNVSLVIERSNFETVQNGPKTGSFPKKIRIKSSKNSQVWETLIEFNILSFPPALDDQLFAIYPSDGVTAEEIS